MPSWLALMADRHAWRWAGLLLLLWAAIGAESALHYQRSGFLAGAWWQPLSAQLMHLSAPHAAVNALVSWLLICWFGPQRLVFCGSALAVAIGLMLDPQCAYYAGASGALHGCLAGGALAQLAQARGRDRYWSALLLVGLLTKLLLAFWFAGKGVNTAAWLGIAVYWPAHVWGSAGGGLTALVLWRFKAFSAEK